MFPDGLYDLILTETAAGWIGADTALTQILSGDAAERLADALARQLAGVLDDIGGTGSDAAVRQLELVNALQVALRSLLNERHKPEAAEFVDTLAAPPRLLKSVRRDRRYPTPPEIGLASPWLFTAGKGSPSLLQEIRRELESANQVDVLVSFITVSGVRKLQDVFQRISALAANEQTSTRIRVITTTYTGVTEARALDELAQLPGCEVRVSLDGRRTRLHAKAWIFHRQTGFGSAYVGSANLSGAALTGGLEWTVKLTQRGQQAMFDRASAHFETLWQDSEFQRYDPENPGHRAALAAALGREAGDSRIAALSFFDLQPKSYQQEMLDQLAAERGLSRCRNLLVAATGTGKTMVAAFDYRDTCRALGGRPRLLFVAHREEILRQALRTYREVLRDPEFGELLAGGNEPDRFDHLFATIDSLTSRGLVASLGTDYWHSVVVDECHRLAADRFHAFVSAIRPRLLLGLTATPERSDGQPIIHYFDARPDGSPSVELRLWHALDLQLLTPFEYYGCDDATDFSAVPWDRPGEIAALDNLVTGNDVRAKLVVREWARLAADIRKSRALVFCVSVAHARFMTDHLNRAGLPAACVVGTTDAEERRRAPQRLASGELCALVTVDLFNEGIDLPPVDTLLLLWPTQSPLLFQQQIGRGLRLAPGKETCLVLDFVGHHRADFRFDRLLSAITGMPRRELAENVENGFGRLPPGCHIHLQRQTRDQVLQSLRELSAQNWPRLIAELQAHATLRGRANISLANFLHDQALELEDIYREANRSGWTTLKRDAGLLAGERGSNEAYFSRRFAHLKHLDDPKQLAAIRAIASKSEPNCPTIEAALRAQMLAYQIDGKSDQIGSHEDFRQRLHAEEAVCSELIELVTLLQSRTSLHYISLPGLEDSPLCLHAAYGVREILTAVGWLHAGRRSPFQAGVLPLSERKSELLFVTLDKSDGYHDRIAYHDYAISTDLFHWQTQNSAGPNTMSGRRYLDSPENGWSFQLFVRARKKQPYRACGPVILERAEGAKPMSIVWRLAVSLPARLFREFSVLRGA
jgi:superfamily II DNA or RNA helicase